MRVYPLEEDVPFDGVVKNLWRGEVMESDAVGNMRVSRITYEICVLQTLREKLRCKEIWVVGADRYRNPDDDLPADFEPLRGTYYEALRLPLDAESFIAGLQQEMRVALSTLDQGLPKNPHVKILPMEGKGPDHFRGYDWFQLREDEEEVFAIKRNRFPRMVVAWYAYEVLLDQADSVEYDFDREEVLASQRHFKFQPQRPALRDFQKFAKEYAGLTYREAEAMFSKITFWNIRTGITSYKDE
jgi:hypothetical protein